MGPQHPSTHGVLRLVLELDGETVVSAQPTIGYLHTGIEKTTEQKKYQQVIPLVERMDYLSSQSNSFAFALSVERLLGIEVPDRVKWIRVLLAGAAADQQPPGLARHARHGARRGLGDALLLPRARAAAQHQRAASPASACSRATSASAACARTCRAGSTTPSARSSIACPAKLDEYEDLLTKNQIFLKRTRGVGRHLEGRRDGVGAGRADRPRLGLDLRRAQGVPVRRLRDVRLRRAGRGDAATCYDRYLVRMEEMRQSMRICQPGARAHHADRARARSTTRASRRRRRTRSTPRWKRSSSTS